MVENVDSTNTNELSAEAASTKIQAGRGRGGLNRGARRGGPPGARGSRGGRGGARGGGVVPIDQMFSSIKERHEQRFGTQSKTLTEHSIASSEETKVEVKSYGANRRKAAEVSISAANITHEVEEENKHD